MGNSGEQRAGDGNGHLDQRRPRVWLEAALLHRNVVSIVSRPPSKLAGLSGSVTVALLPRSRATGPEPGLP